MAEHDSKTTPGFCDDGLVLARARRLCSGRAVREFGAGLLWRYDQGRDPLGSQSGVILPANFCAVCGSGDSTSVSRVRVREMARRVCTACQPEPANWSQRLPVRKCQSLKLSYRRSTTFHRDPSPERRRAARRGGLDSPPGDHTRASDVDSVMGREPGTVVPLSAAQDGLLALTHDGMSCVTWRAGAFEW